MKKNKNPPGPAGNLRPLGQPGSPHPAESASDPASLLEEAKTLHAAGRLSEAQALYGRILKAQPDHWDCLYLLGVVHYQRGEYTQAVGQIDAALRINPKLGAAEATRALALQRLQRFDEALASYDRAIILAPHDASTFYNRGNALGELKRLKEAVASYDRAIALKPDHAGAFYNRGNALHALGRFDEAVARADSARIHS